MAPAAQRPNLAARLGGAVAALALLLVTRPLCPVHALFGDPIPDNCVYGYAECSCTCSWCGRGTCPATALFPSGIAFDTCSGGLHITNSNIECGQGVLTTYGRFRELSPPCQIAFDSMRGTWGCGVPDRLSYNDDPSFLQTCTCLCPEDQLWCTPPAPSNPPGGNARWVRNNGKCCPKETSTCCRGECLTTACCDPSEVTCDTECCGAGQQCVTARFSIPWYTPPIQLTRRHCCPTGHSACWQGPLVGSTKCCPPGSTCCGYFCCTTGQSCVSGPDPNLVQSGGFACVDAPAATRSPPPPAPPLPAAPPPPPAPCDKSRDWDCDSVLDALDNCPRVPNPSQADGDEDGLGDACGCTTKPLSPAAIAASLAALLPASSGWSASWSLTGQGLELKTLRLFASTTANGRLLAESVRFPYLEVATTRSPRTARVELTATPIVTRGTPHSRLVALKTTSLRKATLVTADFDVDGLGVDSASCLRVTQQFLFNRSRQALPTGTDDNPVRGCNPVQGWPDPWGYECGAVQASVSYRMATTRRDERVTAFTAVQRLRFLPDGLPIRKIGLFRDCESLFCPKFKGVPADLLVGFMEGAVGAAALSLGRAPPSPLSLLAPGVGAALRTYLQLNGGVLVGCPDPACGFAIKSPAVSWGVFSALQYPATSLSGHCFLAKSFDNIHMSSGGTKGTRDFRAPQNPIDLGSGCPECIHMHWRWGKVTNLTPEPRTATFLVNKQVKRQVQACMLPEVVSLIATASTGRLSASAAVRALVQELARCIAARGVPNPFSTGRLLKGSAASMEYSFVGRDVPNNFAGFSTSLLPRDTLWLRAKATAASGSVLVHRFFANAQWVESPTATTGTGR